jgi:hypothetical protein
VFAQPRNWKAKVYPDAGEKHVAQFQARVDEMVAILSEQYELEH